MAVWALGASGALDRLENLSSDARARWSLDPSAADPRIVIIDIDNASFRTLTDKLGRWPWTRRVWTELVRYLTPGQPKMLLFDILFSGQEPAADPDFAAVVKKAGNIVLPFAFVSGKIDTSADIFTPPVSAAVERVGPARGRELSRSEWSLNKANAALEAAAAGAGTNLWTPDADGMTRRLPLVVRYEGREWATLWLAAAMKLTGPAAVEFKANTFTAGSIRIPVDPNGDFVARWHGDTLSSYRHVPLWEMICSIYPAQCEAGVTRHPAAEFRDKIVFVGASAAGSYEVRPTPVSETAPGVFVLATALDNLLHNHAVERSPAWLTLGLIMGLAWFPGWCVYRYRSLVLVLAVTLAVMAAFTGLCVVLYRHSYWLTMVAPLLGCAVSFSGNTVLRYLKVDRELSRTRGTLERYVSPQLVGYVMDRLDEFRFDGDKRKLTVFFSDVRSFTTLTEKSDPVVLLKQLNEYLEAMTDIIFRYDGIVDKFIGDGIMAHWGAFTPDRPNAQLAAQASLDMMAKLKELNVKWAAEGRPPLDIGIGLNTAEVIFGNVGAAKKLDFTAIGDGVNLAARLEGTNKEFHTHIIISDSTRRELGDNAQVRPLGAIVVKGKTVGVEIFELTGLLSSSQ